MNFNAEKCNLPQLDPNPEPPSPTQCIMHIKKQKEKFNNVITEVEDLDNYIDLINNVSSFILFFTNKKDQNCNIIMKFYYKFAEEFKKKFQNLNFFLIDETKNQELKT